jgi:threonine aldolase
VAIEQMADRVGEDHVRARQLAHGLAEIPGVDVAPVATNILYFWLAEQVSKTQEEVRDELAKRGILVGGRADGRFRAVTHYWISDEDIQATTEAVRAVV